VTQNTNAPTEPTRDHTSHEDEREEYGGGAIESRHGYIPLWLLGVYAVLFIWGLYYAYTYWGGLGPGRIYMSAPPESREVID
jgi:hypothetical protein